MKRNVIALLLIWAVSLTWADTLVGRPNVFMNADLTKTDGLGLAIGWEPYGWAGARLFAKAGENGVITLTAENERTGYFPQAPVGLKSGGRYRFSAEVRSALPKGAKFGFICWPTEWNCDVKVWFPENTQGQWCKVEKDIVAPASHSPDKYSIGFVGAGTVQGLAQMEIRNVMLTALDDASEAAVRRRDLSAFKPLVSRIVPIDPLLSEVRQKNAEITFYWPGEPKGGVAGCTLSGVLMQDGTQPGKRAKAKFGADGRAKLSFGAIGGEKIRYRLDLQVVGRDGRVLATNDYWVSGHPDLPKGPEPKKLNNFVAELVNAELKDGSYDFFRPKDGWVWISFDGGARTASGWLDDLVVPVIAARPNERAIEQMRYVTAGWHRLKVEGAKGGRLRIHQVKRLGMPSWPVSGGPCDFSGDNYRYSFPFVHRYLLNAMNTTMMANEFLENRCDPTRTYYGSRGFDVMGCLRLHFHYPHRDDGGIVYGELNRGAWANGWNCGFDENKIHDSRHNLVEMSEVLWRMIGERPNQALDMFWGDATNFSYDDPQVHTAFLSAVLNSGNGRGVLLPEVYAASLSTPEETDKWVDLFAQQIRQVGELVPGGRDRTCLHLAPYVNIWSWNDEPCPETDIKAHYSRMMHIFATDPRFAENAGLSTGAGNCCEEELRRWHARCQRHYGIEGGTNDLAKQYGFAWNPGLVKNPDFADGLTGWEATVAKGGGIRGDKIAGYGRRLQRRMKVRTGTGDGFAEFTATDAGENRLSQKLAGLVPGRFYALRFCVANRANTVSRMKDPPPCEFSAQVEGGELVKGLCYLRRTKGWGISGMTGSGGAFLFNHRLVFKATANEATLTFVDRGEKGERVPAGTRQIVNFVMLRPYYCETPEEPHEIAALLNLKGK